MPYTQRTGIIKRFYNHLGQELKFLDSVRNNTLVPNAGTILNSLCLIQEGVEESQRIGRRIVVTSIACRWEIILPIRDTGTVLSLTEEIVRIIVYIDHQTNGANANILNILETAEYESFRNLSNMERFTILYDKSHRIYRKFAFASDIEGLAFSPEVRKQVTFFTKCDIAIDYRGTSSGINEIESNNIGMMYISSFGLADIINSKCRIRYKG